MEPQCVCVGNASVCLTTVAQPLSPPGFGDGCQLIEWLLRRLHLSQNPDPSSRCFLSSLRFLTIPPSCRRAYARTCTYNGVRRVAVRQQAPPTADHSRPAASAQGSPPEPNHLESLKFNLFPPKNIYFHVVGFVSAPSSCLMTLFNAFSPASAVLWSVPSHQTSVQTFWFHVRLNMSQVRLEMSRYMVRKMLSFHRWNWLISIHYLQTVMADINTLQLVCFSCTFHVLWWHKNQKMKWAWAEPDKPFKMYLIDYLFKKKKTFKTHK